MARLNEAGIPTESVDALKRRFIRQNRELAKNNSTQSIRIRCLEAEISRLLTENLHLREEILQLRNEVENVPNRHAVANVKKAMEAKMNELGKLVMELGLLQKPGATRGQDGQKRSPSVGWGRGGGEIDGSDGRLPTIREDKSFPRRTLDAQEIRQMAYAANDSPDLGSPPVAHFQDEDPITFNPSPDTAGQGDPEKDSTDLPPSLSVNLETRKKRRDSNSRLTIRRMSVFHSPPDKIEDENGNGGGKVINQAPPVRAGAKRKLAAREEETKVDGKPEGFTFSRRGAETPEEPSTESQAKTDVKPRSRKETSNSGTTILAERKALGEKSINTDPIVSPKKTSKHATISDEKAKDKSKRPSLTVQRDASKLKNLPRRPKTPADNPQPISNPAPTAPQVVELPPKTPAALDLFSPLSTEPSTARAPQGRDTPPPADLDASENGGRAGRRARAVVSYAEPSLISKMRRPTKDLCDAVGKDGRPLSVTGAGNGKSVTIKTEPISDDDGGGGWKALHSGTSKGEDIGAGSPLSKKSSAPTTAVPPMDTRTEESSSRDSKKTQQSQSSSAAAISALVNSNRRKTQTQSQANDSITLAKPAVPPPPRTQADLSIYDFTSSSPPKNTISLGRTSRRHSSISALNSSMKPEENAAKTDKPARLERHKRQSSVGSSALKSEAERVVPGAERDGDADAGLGRSERAASRRRSMML